MWSLNTAVALQGLCLGAETVASPVTAEMFSPPDAVTARAREEVTTLASLHTLVTVVSALREAIADQVLDEWFLLVKLTYPLI